MRTRFFFLILCLRNLLYGVFLLLLSPALLLAKDKKKWLRLLSAKLSATTPAPYQQASKNCFYSSSKQPLPLFDAGFLSASLGEAKLALEFARALAANPKGPKSFVFWSENFSGLDYYRLKLPQVFSKEAFPQQINYLTALHPFDFSFSWRKSLRSFPVKQLFLLESAYWPNTIDITAKQGHRVISINSRLQAGTLRLARCLGWLGLTAFKQIDHFYTSAPSTEKNLLCLAVPKQRISLVPSFKTALFPPIDNDLLQQEHQKLFRAPKAGDFLTVVGSVHVDEIAYLLKAWLIFLKQTKLKQPAAAVKTERTRPAKNPSGNPAKASPRLKHFVLVLRHPEKADKVRRLLSKKLGAALTDKGDYQLFPEGVGLVSSFGTLLRWYSLADCVIVGGSFNARGGQNFCEPIALGKYTAVGPYTKNFEAEKVLFRRYQALEVLPNRAEVVAFWERAFLNDEHAQHYAARGYQALQQHVFDWDKFAERVLTELRPQA